MTHTINDVPEQIWVELIISNNMFEIKVPNGKRTPLIAQAYEWTKDRDISRIRVVKPSAFEENSKKFQAILDDLNRNGSSEEHNYWRSIVIQHRNK